MKKEKNFFLKNYKTFSNEEKKNYFLKETINTQKSKLVHPDKKTISLFLILIGAKTAAKILKNLSDDEVKKIISEIIKLEKITEEDIAKVRSEIGNIEINFDYTNFKPKEYALELLTASFPLKKAFLIFNSVLNLKEKIERYKKPDMSFLEKLTEKEIYEIICNESPVIISAILSLLKPIVIAKVLSLFPNDKKIGIIKKIAQKIEIQPEILETIIEKLKEKALKYKNHKQYQTVNGKAHLAKILRLLPFQKKEMILDSLKIENENLADQIEDNLFKFEELIKIPKKSLIYALKKCKNQDIAFMLKGTSNLIKEAVLNSVSKKRRIIIEEEMNFLGKVKKSDVEKKQKEFISYLKKLESKGKVILFPDSEEYVE